MSIPSTSTNLSLDTKRHSFAHLMACAVQIYFKELEMAENAKNQKLGISVADSTSPQVQFGVGPVIDNGCYYDFILPRPLIPEDLPKIEKTIRKLLKQDLRFERIEVTLEEAMEVFASSNQPLKVELLENLRDKGTTSLSEEERADLGVNVEAESPSYKEGAQRGGGVLPYNPELTEKAKDLRNNSSKAEIRFWCELKNHPELSKIDFHRQKPILEYIVDFYVQDYNLVIELDGDSHNHQMEYDQKRTQDLEKLGVKVMRYSNEDVQNNLEGVFRDVLGYIKTHPATTSHPSQEGTGSAPSSQQSPKEDLLPSITLYRLINNKTGEILFEDLCKGPHIETMEEFSLVEKEFKIKGETKINKLGKIVDAVSSASGFYPGVLAGEMLKNSSKKVSVENKTSPLGFALDKFSASYWRGDQARGINMQRLYALVFETEEELETFKTFREEAKKFDHRVLGQELDLFSFSDLVGSGLPLFSPKGTLLRNTLKAMLFQVSKSYGCQEVTIPHMARLELYETSGHAKKFAGELFHVKSHYDIDFVLKPVNCPHHTQIFASKMRSYRDLPLRYIESTMQYRDEKPGAIGGLTRVRSITCDDGHTFCTPDQIKGEILSLCKTIEEFYTNLGMYGNHWVSISVRDYQNLDNYTGFPEDWDKAESMLKEINQELGLNGKICEGEAAIYGPKLDFMYKDIQGNERQLSTVQLDFATPKRFGLTYREADGSERPPVMIHRAILGSYERFLAILLESTKGRFPFWLAPVQLKILTINNQPEVLEYVDKIKAILSQIVLMKPLKYNELRFEVDDRQESLGKKIREGEMAKIPVLLIVGPKDIEANQVSVRTQSGEEKVKLEGLEGFLKGIK